MCQSTPCLKEGPVCETVTYEYGIYFCGRQRLSESVPPEVFLFIISLNIVFRPGCAKYMRKSERETLNLDELSLVFLSFAPYNKNIIVCVCKQNT